MSKLPDKPSALIRVALHDLKLCEQDPKYRINMKIWHKQNEKTCSVCFAGSVMAKTLEISSTGVDAPSLDPMNKDAWKLRSLDWFRKGQVRIGLSLLQFETTEGAIWNREVPEYRKDPKGFKLAMYALAADLERAGL